MGDLKFLALANFNEINPHEVWDFCYSDEVPTSPFQFQILLSRAEQNQHLTDEYRQFPNTTINTLDKQIMGSLFKKLFYNHNIINTNIKFLEHQYRVTRDKNIFLCAVEKTIYPPYYMVFWGDDIPIVANAHDILNEIRSWRERKLEQLSYHEYLNDIASPALKQNISHSIQNGIKTPKSIEEIFNNPSDVEPCLSILRQLDKPFIDADFNYIGKNKGVFPLWINILKNHVPKPLIKHFPDLVYKDILNGEITGLRLSKDASEFRKTYQRLANDKVELQIRTLLSQLSQSGRLGK